MLTAVSPGMVSELDLEVMCLLGVFFPVEGLSKIFSNNCAEVNSLLAEARSLAEPVCMQRGDLTPGASWERSRAISSAGKHVAGVGKHHDNNRGLLLCLFPEMYFHSLRYIHAG